MNRWYIEFRRIDWVGQVVGYYRATTTCWFQLSCCVLIRPSTMVSLGHWFPLHLTDPINICTKCSLHLTRIRCPHPCSITRSVYGLEPNYSSTVYMWALLTQRSSTWKAWDDLCHHLTQCGIHIQQTVEFLLEVVWGFHPQTKVVIDFPYTIWVLKCVMYDVAYLPHLWFLPSITQVMLLFIYLYGLYLKCP